MSTDVDPARTDGRPSTPPEGAYRSFDPLGMSPADPGWRAVFSYADGQGRAEVEPLIAWGVYQLTWRSFATDEIVRTDGTTIDGIVRDFLNTDPPAVRHLVSARALGVTYYLPPGAPDPVGAAGAPGG